jgi:hypothetical protein
MTPTPTPAEIAARLSPAQKRALRWLEGPHHRAMWLPGYAGPSEVTHFLLAGKDRRIKVKLDDWDALKGLVKSIGARDRMYGLTPLGLAVRAELERMEARDE